VGERSGGASRGVGAPLAGAMWRGRAGRARRAGRRSYRGGPAAPRRRPLARRSWVINQA